MTETRRIHEWMRAQAVDRGSGMVSSVIPMMRAGGEQQAPRPEPGRSRTREELFLRVGDNRQ